MGWAELAATTLENEHVRLRPFVEADRESLRPLAMDPEIWRYFVIRVETDADFDAFFDTALADLAAGRRVPYLVTDLRGGRAAGTMSFLNIAEPDGRIEIGWARLGRDFRGRGVNPPAEVLLVVHARGPAVARVLGVKDGRRQLRA